MTALDTFDLIRQARQWAAARRTMTLEWVEQEQAIRAGAPRPRKPPKPHRVRPLDSLPPVPRKPRSDPEARRQALLAVALTLAPPGERLSSQQVATATGRTLWGVQEDVRVLRCEKRWVHLPGWSNGRVVE